MTDAELKEQLLKKRQAIVLLHQQQENIYHSNIAAIDTTIKAIESVSSFPLIPPEERLTDAILFAIDAAPVEFSIRDIARIIALRNPGKTIKDNSIAPTYWKIVQDGLGIKFEIAHEGAGNRPTIYRKK